MKNTRLKNKCSVIEESTNTAKLILIQDHTSSETEEEPKQTDVYNFSFTNMGQVHHIASTQKIVLSQNKQGKG